MYAVVCDGNLIYSGNNLVSALSALESKVGSSLHNVDNLSKETLESIGVKANQNQWQSTLEEKITNLEQIAKTTFNAVADKIKTFQEDVPEQLYNKTEQVIEEIKELGTNGIKKVNDNLKAIGDLFKKEFKNQ